MSPLASPALLRSDLPVPGMRVPLRRYMQYPLLLPLPPLHDYAHCYDTTVQELINRTLFEYGGVISSSGVDKLSCAGTAALVLYICASCCTVSCGRSTSRHRKRGTSIYASDIRGRTTTRYLARIAGYRPLELLLYCCIARGRRRFLTHEAR